jgi:predicted anti-sigma-YlaC factor YlaD
MTRELSAHLSEEAIHDVLIGLSSPESDAHLAVCSICRSQVKEFHSEVDLFNRASLAWSEARPSTTLRSAARPRVRSILFAPFGWALAAMALLAIGVPVWNHHHRPSLNSASAPVSAQEDSEAQIAQDNELLRSVDMALNENEEPPISEYHLSDGPYPRLKARPELRNR